MFFDIKIFNGLSLHIDVNAGKYDLRDGDGNIVAQSTVADGIMDAHVMETIMKAAAFLKP